ncbi:MAG: D-cysteine desulfhydrase [Defluviitaleaceae bacterium]|nr:D-cysteine desulfhydrase [Defluviitaleaceae bacterium]
MNISRFPRRRYTLGYTPIEKLNRLSDIAGGGVNIYVKRDDMLGLTGGGNKTRVLEFLMADALEKGADTIITCGAVQSNHCRLTLAAAVKEGLKCHLVIEQRVPKSYDATANGNNFLFNLLGVEGTHVVDGGSDMLAEMEKVANLLKSQNRNPYIIPGGGSNAIGSLGYVACMQELLCQFTEMNLSMDYIVLTSGSGGTHTGMLCGAIGFNANIPIIGIGINRPKDVQRKSVFTLCDKTSDLLNLKNRPCYEDVIVFDDYIGKGYSYVTDGMLEAVKLTARTEGILLDPIYTGKCMAGLLDLIKKGYFPKGKNVLFLHTGGSASLYAYTNEFTGS